jgi:hypothetical protein
VSLRRNQIVLLGRTFFKRLFESDLMPPGVPQEQILIWSMAVLAMPGLAVPMIFTPKYSRLAFSPGALEPAIALDRMLLITLSMMAIGFAALVVWEGVFPDRRDARILSPLPVRTTTLVLARLSALGVLFCLFTAAITIIPAILFPMIVGGYLRAQNPFVGIAAQFVAAVAGCAFAFFSLLALQCSLLVALGRNMAQRLSVVLQVVFTVGLLQMILLIPRFGVHLRGGQLAPEWLSSSAALMMPPIWFVALYQTLEGTGGAEAARLATVAIAASLGAIAGTLVLYAASYSRLTKQALETCPPPRRASIISAPVTAATLLVNRAPAWMLGSQVERAVCAFTLRTLVRSRQHRMLFAVYTAVALAIVVSTALPVVFRGGALLTRPHPALGTTTPVLIFFMLVGLRMLVTIPVDPKARWAVRVCEPADRYAAINGTRRAMLLVGLMPCIILTLVVLTPLWGFIEAARHALFWTVMGILLTELLLVSFPRIPFTCTYHPVGSGFRTWPGYVLGFAWYVYGMTILELAPLKPPGMLATFYVVAAAVIVLLQRLRARTLAEIPGLQFDDEDPGALFAGFSLSEGMAAAKRPIPSP